MLAQNYNTLTREERRDIRNEYVAEQNGLCYYCKSSLHDDPPKHILSKKIDWRAFPPNFLRYPIHLHHSHETGLTIGAVHSRCNAVLWQYHGE